MVITHLLDLEIQTEKTKTNRETVSRKDVASQAWETASASGHARRSIVNCLKYSNDKEQG